MCDICHWSTVNTPYGSSMEDPGHHTPLLLPYGCIKWCESFLRMVAPCMIILLVLHCHIHMDVQGVPKKIVILSGFEFLTLGGVFLGVKNNSKNSGTKKNIRLLSKILSKMTLLFSKLSHFLEFSWLCQFQKFKNLLKSQDI